MAKAQGAETRPSASDTLDGYDPADNSRKSYELAIAVKRGTVLAIDPGMANGIAIIDRLERLLLASEIPVIGEGANKRLNMTSFRDMATQFNVSQAVIEDVAAMPGQGVTSMFRFGRAAGSFEGAISALRIPVHFVRPASWKKALGAKAKEAEDIRALAIQTWPDMAASFARKKDHNRAEAALIGLWYLRHVDVMKQ